MEDSRWGSQTRSDRKISVAQLQPLRDPKCKLTDDERRTIVKTVDESLGPARPTLPNDWPSA